MHSHVLQICDHALLTPARVCLRASRRLLEKCCLQKLDGDQSFVAASHRQRLINLPVRFPCSCSLSEHDKQYRVIDSGPSRS